MPIPWSPTQLCMLLYFESLRSFSPTQLSSGKDTTLWIDASFDKKLASTTSHTHLSNQEDFTFWKEWLGLVNYQNWRLRLAVLNIGCSRQKRLAVLNIQTVDNCIVSSLLSGSEKWTAAIFNRCISELSFLDFMPIPRSQRASQEPAMWGGRSVSGHVPCTLRSARQVMEIVPVGWGRISFMAIDGSPASHCPKYLQGRSFWCGSSTCTASALDPTDPLNRGYQGARSTLRRKLPVVAGCRCLFFGSRVAACGIHATADEDNQPMQS